MKNVTKKMSAMFICGFLVSMQVVNAAVDTGLGNGIGGAVINNYTDGCTGITKGANSATLNFNKDAHVNWNTLNVNKNETLNFNAASGVKGITVLNTVNNEMTKVYGSINANDGIGKLIIANPNGLLFDGANVTAAGDVMLSTQGMGATFSGDKMTLTYGADEALNAVVIKNSDFSVGGEFFILSPSVELEDSTFNVANGFKMVTADGHDYLVAPTSSETATHTAVAMRAVNINGDIYIVSAKDIVKIANGATIKGDLNIESDGNVALNYTHNDNLLNVDGNINVVSDGKTSYLRNAKVTGNVDMSNSGGFLEIKDVKVDGDVKLKTTVATNVGVKHFVHVVGDNDIGGNLDVDSIHNIHIGGYNSDLKTLEDGHLTVGGDMNALAREGSIAVTVDTTADKISLESGSLNIITDGEATIKANEYNFKATTYIGGLDSDLKVIDSMEGYKLLTPKTKTFLNIDGGKITTLKTAGNGFAFVKSKNNLQVDGVNANKVNLSADQTDIVIGDNVHANIISVDGDTKNLTVNTDARDYTLKYTDIKDTEVITIDPSTKITYEMANGAEGWNKGTQTADNTYLVVPGTPVPPQPTPDPDPDPDGPNNEPEKNIPTIIYDDLTKPLVSTPIAYAADLDDDEKNRGVRKNVDGSVTVVKTFAVGK